MNYPYIQKQPQWQPKWLWLLLVVALLMLWVRMARAEEINLTASWYSIESLKREGTYKYSNGRCADGSIFKDENYSCAIYGYKFGTILKVTNLKTGASVQVMVTDRIGKRFKGKRIDLTPIAFKAISGKQGLKEGLLKVKIEVLKLTKGGDK